jgi:hypothetical protein
VLLSLKWYLSIVYDWYDAAACLRRIRCIQDCMAGILYSYSVLKIDLLRLTLLSNGHMAHHIFGPFL